MEILAGLNMTVVSRLKEAWSHLSQKYLDVFDELNALMDHKNNYGVYRRRLTEELANHNWEQLPVIPYLGIFLRDLKFCTEIPMVVDNMINFQQLMVMGDILLFLEKILKQPCVLPPEDLLVFNFLNNLKAMNEDQLYELHKKTM
jgi:hypothetical protein